MTIGLNATNYNRTRNLPSVHANRGNVSARFQERAYAKAMESRSPNVIVVEEQTHCHEPSGFAKVMMGINATIGGLATGFGITSGNGAPMNNMAMGGMPGMGMPGMGFGSPYCNGGMNPNMMSMNGSIFPNHSGWC